ncbi:DUF559 domain-containing protein [Smaragdicoccus niigatensis]|uniref:DUF559 domain-containing protein n=1 Tax=Smaragdicoccus niigatensis TaxID=359359 RepID=UPI000373073E|nr:DUF559 domain-containing protein [Smaragdicoccus niigatensis]
MEPQTSVKRLRSVYNEKFARRIAAQNGVVTLAQARESGVTDDSVHYLVKIGELRALSKGVYLSNTHHMSHEARLRAAVFACGKDAVASGLSAAWWHGLHDVAVARPSVTIPVKRRVRRVQQFDIRRRTLADVDMAVVRGLAVSGLALTVVEAATALPEGSVLMDRALQTRISLVKLIDAHERNAGRDGSAQARKLLEVASSGGRSEAEKLFHRILDANDICGWSAQVTSIGYDLDLAFVLERVAIEIDGWAFHRDSARNSRDMKRQNALANAGWHVLRFDWHRLTHDPEGVVSEIQRALGRNVGTSPY